MHKLGYSTPATPFRPSFSQQAQQHRWTKSMGKPSAQNLKANYNVRRTPNVRR